VAKVRKPIMCPDMYVLAPFSGTQVCSSLSAKRCNELGLSTRKIWGKEEASSKVK